MTGALLIYAKDIQRLINPDFWTVTPEKTTIAYPALINTIEVHTKQKVTMLMPEQQPQFAWQIQLSNKQYVSVNPYNADILLKYDYYSTIYGFTMALHRWLLYEDSDGQKPLKNWVSICALIFIINMLIGVYLWIKPKNRIRRLVIKPKAKLRILLYQLHTVLGVYLFLVLILIAFTGMAFNFKDETKAVLEFTTQNTVEARPTAPTLTVPKNINRDQFAVALENGLSVFPKGVLFRIYLPKEPNDAIALRIKNPGESHAYSWVWANQYTGQVLQKYDASKANFTTQAWNFKYKFHIGDFAGSLLQALWLLLALLPLLFSISGVYFWYKRHYR